MIFYGSDANWQKICGVLLVNFVLSLCRNHQWLGSPPLLCGSKPSFSVLGRILNASVNEIGGEMSVKPNHSFSNKTIGPTFVGRVFHFSGGYEVAVGWF
jgi:hypothetical protein